MGEGEGQGRAGRTEDEDREMARLRQERDLYRQILDLGTRDEIPPFLEEALALIATVSGATQGYVELQDPHAEPDAARVWMARGCSDTEVETIRENCSQGIVAEALATGQTILTESAFLDPRFQGRGSVQRNRIEAVLCTPIGRDPPLGVLYLQGRERPGPFSVEDCARAETFARHLAAFADRLLIRRVHSRQADPTRPFREKLRASAVIGRSPAVADVLKQAALVAPLHVSVLITGPSGTGKTQLARVIHDNSPRASGPFHELNCAALPGDLFERELFGHRRGAFTGADRDQAGLVAAAEHGTLFLDEVGDLALPAQAKLLQLVQSMEYRPLGGTELCKADVRIVAATNVDLRAAIARREFREDLFFRLETLPIRVPSLAERREDVPELCKHFCQRTCEQNRFRLITFSVGALRAAEAAEWPGNVRELANAVQRAVIRADADDVLQVEQRHLFPFIAGIAGPAGAEAGPDAEAAPETFQAATRRFQERLLRKALTRARWNVSEAARRLDLTRAHVHGLIRAFGIERGS